MTIVVNLCSWAGPEWSSVPGDHLDLDDAIATERVVEGLCELPVYGKAVIESGNAQDGVDLGPPVLGKSVSEAGNAQDGVDAAKA